MIEYDYASLHKLLVKKTLYKPSNDVLIENHGTIGTYFTVYWQGERVATIWRDTVFLYDGGWRTKTTLNLINKIIERCKWTLVAPYGEWHLACAGEEPKPFENGVGIDMSTDNINYARAS